MTCAALLLNWCETDIVKDSARRLTKEGHQVLIVDNGSDDLEKLSEYKVMAFGENLGSSRARNIGIKELLKGNPDFIFLLDGDILYVKDTIGEYMLAIPDDAGCLGGSNADFIATYGHNGTPFRDQADLQCTVTSQPRDDFPMAWTQYGLFRSDVFKKCLFDENYGIGMGYEDDDFYHQMLKHGFKSYYVPEPTYYHNAHSGQRQLRARKVDDREVNRKEYFEKKWDRKGWMETKA